MAKNSMHSTTNYEHPVWKIWYDDGTKFSSNDGSPEQAPQDGIQAIVERKENGNVGVYEGHEYYWWTGDCWAHGGLNSLERWLRAICPGVKFGRFTENAIHKAIMEEIHG